MAALGGSAIALLGAVHPLWRINMAVMAGMTLATMLIIALTLPESPIWLLRKGGRALEDRFNFDLQAGEKEIAPV